MTNAYIASAFIEQNGRYLLVYDPKFRFWRVPGGRLEESESECDCLEREMREELDIDIKIEKYLGFGKDIVTLYTPSTNIPILRTVKYYECAIESGEPRIVAKDEILEMKWLTLDEIKNTEPLEPALTDFFSKQ